MTQTCRKTVANIQISRSSPWAARNFTRDAPKPIKTVPNIEKQKWVCLWDFGNRVRGLFVVHGFTRLPSWLKSVQVD
ncbi:hypothetical protein P3S67_020019 [Capsicum chacoense]